MKTILAGLFAASTLAVSPIVITTAAHAAIVAGSDVCGELPNSKWTWSIKVTEPQVILGDVTYGSVTYNGQSGNGSAPASQEVTTIPGSTICTAHNPAGKINADHSTTVGGGEPTTETVSLGMVQVCFQGPNTPDLIAGCR